MQCCDAALFVSGSMGFLCMDRQYAIHTNMIFTGEVKYKRGCGGQSKTVSENIILGDIGVHAGSVCSIGGGNLVQP